MRLISTSILLVFCLLLTTSKVYGDEKTFNYQGRLTDPGGSPVADGKYEFTFTLFSSDVGGFLLWSEGPVQVAVNDGLFSVEIGSISPVPFYLFDQNDSLWLEVSVEGETMAPRKYLGASPFSRMAAGLNAANSALKIMRTDANDCRISTYGLDNLEQIRLWGCEWGELYLYDDDPANNLAAYLTAEGSIGGNSSGGALFLNRDGGGTMSFETHQLGDASVNLFSNAINADEMLNEPGIAQAASSAAIFLDSGLGIYDVDSVEISVPSAGYVVLQAGCYINLFHQTGTTSSVWFSTSNNSGTTELAEGVAVAGVPPGAPTGNWQFPATSSRVIQVAAGTHKFYSIAEYNSGAGTPNITRTYLRATFFPTIYGTVSTSSSLPHQERSPLVHKLITVEEHEAALEELRKEFEARLEVRLRNIEEQLSIDGR